MSLSCSRLQCKIKWHQKSNSLQRAASRNPLCDTPVGSTAIQSMRFDSIVASIATLLCNRTTYCWNNPINGIRKIYSLWEHDCAFYFWGHVPVPHLRNIKSKYLSELQTQSMHLCFCCVLCFVPSVWLHVRTVRFLGCPWNVSFLLFVFHAFGWLPECLRSKLKKQVIISILVHIRTVFVLYLSNTRTVWLMTVSETTVRIIPFHHKVCCVSKSPVEVTLNVTCTLPRRYRRSTRTGNKSSVGAS